MGDWLKPTLTDLYSDFLDYIKQRDDDCRTFFMGVVSDVTFTDGGSGLNDLHVDGWPTAGRHFVIEIDGTGDPDTFKWSKDGGTTWEATGVNVSTNDYDLSDGIKVCWSNTTGHALGDRWEFTTEVPKNLPNRTIVFDPNSKSWHYWDSTRNVFWNLSDIPYSATSAYAYRYGIWVDKASKLIDESGEDYTLGHGFGNIPINDNNLNVGLNADKVDGYNASQTPTAGQIPVLATDGSLKLPFVQTPIYVNDQDLMSRTFYVDAVNGDDNNPGTEDNPFKTLEKAINSVPVGGSGEIFLVSDYSTSDAEIISIINKHITVRFQNGAKLYFNIVDAPYPGYGMYVPEFRLLSSAIFFNLSDSSDSQLIVNECPSGYSNIVYGPIHAVHGVNSVTIYAYHPNNKPIVIHDFCLIVGYNAISFGAYLDVRLALYSATIQVNQGAYLVQANSEFCFRVHPSFSIEDENGASRDYADVITPIIRDTNGVPRNIISNLVL